MIIITIATLITVHNHRHHRTYFAQHEQVHKCICRYSHIRGGTWSTHHVQKYIHADEAQFPGILAEAYTCTYIHMSRLRLCSMTRKADQGVAFAPWPWRLTMGFRLCSMTVEADNGVPPLLHDHGDWRGVVTHAFALWSQVGVTSLL